MCGMFTLYPPDRLFPECYTDVQLYQLSAPFAQNVEQGSTGTLTGDVAPPADVPG